MFALKGYLRLAPIRSSDYYINLQKKNRTPNRRRNIKWSPRRTRTFSATPFRASTTTLAAFSNNGTLELMTICSNSLTYSDVAWSLMSSMNSPRRYALRRPRRRSTRPVAAIVPLQYMWRQGKRACVPGSIPDFSVPLRTEKQVVIF